MIKCDGENDTLQKKFAFSNFKYKNTGIPDGGLGGKLYDLLVYLYNMQYEF